jgi:acyl-CoA thioester hydrolase
VSVAAGHRVQMRWRDIDGLGHVNHAVALTYLEEGRDRFLAGHGIGRDEYVVGSCSLRFKDEIDPGLDAVIVECELRSLGQSSVATSERIIGRDGEVMVEAEFRLVLWDGKLRASRPISDRERASLGRDGEGDEEP